MTLSEYKETCRLFWIVKGHLPPIHWDEAALWSIHNSYFDRVWKNEESYSKEGGLEASKKRGNKGIFWSLTSFHKNATLLIVIDGGLYEIV